MQHWVALLAQQPPQEPQPRGLFEDPTFPILLVAMVAAFYVIMILPAKRREKKERDELLTKLKKNDEVLTSSGIIGIVAQVKDDEVILKIDENSNARLRVHKSTIARILNPKEAAKDASGKAGQDGQAPDNVKAGSPPAGK